MKHDFLRSAPEGRLTAQDVRPQPVSRLWPEGKEFLANGVINRGVIIPQQIDQGCPLALGETLRGREETSRFHTHVPRRLLKQDARLISTTKHLDHKIICAQVLCRAT